MYLKIIHTAVLTLITVTIDWRYDSRKRIDYFSQTYIEVNNKFELGDEIDFIINQSAIQCRKLPYF